MIVNKVKSILAVVLVLGLFSSGLGGLAALDGIGQPGAAAAEPSPSLKKAISESVWNDLGDTDNVRVTRAILALATAGPQDSVAFLAERMRPVKVDNEQVQQLLADLDSTQFAKRQQAAAELEYLGKFVKPQLDKALSSRPSAELRQRIEQLLSKMPKEEKEKKQPANPQVGGMQVSASNGTVSINGQVGKLIVNGVEVPLTPAPVAQGPALLWVRAVRAVTVLEEMGTPEAKQLLEKVAQGEAEALPTKAAKAALERLNGKR